MQTVTQRHFTACEWWLIWNGVRFDSGVQIFKFRLTDHSLIGKLRWPICHLTSSKLPATAGKTQNLCPATGFYSWPQIINPKLIPVWFGLYLCAYLDTKHTIYHILTVLSKLPVSWNVFGNLRHEGPHWYAAVRLREPSALNDNYLISRKVFYLKGFYLKTFWRFFVGWIRIDPISGRNNIN